MVESWPPARVMHLRTDVHVWRRPEWSPFQSALDAALWESGSRPLDLPWEEFRLQADGDHFTPAGLRAFAEAFARAVSPLKGERVCVLSDSTIGEDAWASDAVARALRARGARDVRVDAVNGSGFVARAWSGEHFYPRVRAMARAVAREEEEDGSGTAVVFVGGWNDARGGDVDADVARACARRCVAAAGWVGA
jgi:hypothetical protein